MENTPQNKVRLFAQYYETKVARSPLLNDNLPPQICYPELALKPENKFYLELTHLSHISDEDAIKLTEKAGYFFEKVVRSKNYIYVTCKYNDYEDAMETLRIYHNGEIFYLNENGKVCELSMEQAEESISFIRSLGIAYQFNGNPVEEQIKFGWIKLKA